MSDPDPSALEALERAYEWCEERHRKNEFTWGDVALWDARVRPSVARMFGADSIIVNSLRRGCFPPPTPLPNSDAIRSMLVEKQRQFRLLLDDLHYAEQRAFGNSSQARKVFIGHGGSLVWRVVKDFVVDVLRLQYIEFNSEPTGGIATHERLAEMLNESMFALLVMTAEDEHADKSRHARENVVHEVGLFQGRLGPRRAIILQQEECAAFSNIHGLTTLRFSGNNVNMTFEGIRGALKREGLIS